LGGYIDADQSPVILHFGDHDPSGLDMTRDLTERLGLYAEAEVRVERLALNFDQVEQYEPPPNPAKTTDSRYASYVEIHGEESWELDALEPGMIAELITETVINYRDEQLWNEATARQEAARERLQDLSDNWED